MPDHRLQILAALHSDGPLAARELARRCGDAGLRTTSRRLSELIRHGAPIAGRRGRGGAYDFSPDYRERLKQLPTQEVLHRLQWALSTGPTRESFDQAAARKRPPGLYIAGAADEDAAWEAFAFDPREWNGPAGPGERLDLLYQAIRRRRLVSFSVAGARRAVAPLKLIEKAGAFYLLAQLDGELRAYPFVELAEIQLESETFERPAAETVKAVWEREVAARGAELRTTTIRLRLDHNVYLTFIRDRSDLKDQIVNRSSDPDGWLTLTVETPDWQDWAHEISVRRNVEPLEPPEFCAVAKRRSSLPR